MLTTELRRQHGLAVQYAGRVSSRVSSNPGRRCCRPTRLSGDAPPAQERPVSPMPASCLALAQAQAHYWQQQMALYMGMVASATGKTRGADRRSPSAATAVSCRSLAQQCLVQPAQADIPAQRAPARTTWSKRRASATRKSTSCASSRASSSTAMSPANFAATNPEATASSRSRSQRRERARGLRATCSKT